MDPTPTTQWGKGYPNFPSNGPIRKFTDILELNKSIELLLQWSKVKSRMRSHQCLILDSSSESFHFHLNVFPLYHPFTLKVDERVKEWDDSRAIGLVLEIIIYMYLKFK